MADSEWLAVLARFGLVRASFIPLNQAVEIGSRCGCGKDGHFDLQLCDSSVRFYGRFVNDTFCQQRFVNDTEVVAILAGAEINERARTR